MNGKSPAVIQNQMKFPHFGRAREEASVSEKTKGENIPNNSPKIRV